MFIPLCILDVRAPPSLNDGAVFIEGSILERSKLPEIFRGCDCIVHIAAWHGIREDRSTTAALHRGSTRKFHHRGR
jgi:nucleoside-diphosphate-sugar epimerase